MSLSYSDTSNKSGIIQLCEIYSGLADGAISGNSTLLKQFTRLLNNAYQKLITTIFESQDDWDWDDIGTTDGTNPSQTTYPVITFPLVAGQRDYSLGAAVKIMKVRRVDVSFDGINFFKCEPWDSQQTGLGLGNDANTDARFAKTKPFYDLRANSIWLYPTASSSDVTAGAEMRVEFLREPIEFSSANTTNTPGIDTAFQPMLALDASINYSIVNAPSLVPSLQGQYTDMEARLRRYVSRKDEDRQYQLTSAYINMN